LECGKMEKTMAIELIFRPMVLDILSNFKMTTYIAKDRWFFLKWMEIV
jgi:hypothetical protein